MLKRKKLAPSYFQRLIQHTLKGGTIVPHNLNQHLLPLTTRKISLQEIKTENSIIMTTSKRFKFKTKEMTKKTK
jgi:hypothetical protein